ncbi:hypothetical protein IWX46DRAFT_580058 [Phyllosticta citricarpa]
MLNPSHRLGLGLALAALLLVGGRGEGLGHGDTVQDRTGEDSTVQDSTSTWLSHLRFPYRVRLLFIVVVGVVFVLFFLSSPVPALQDLRRSLPKPCQATTTPTTSTPRPSIHSLIISTPLGLPAFPDSRTVVALHCATPSSGLSNQTCHMPFPTTLSRMLTSRAASVCAGMRSELIALGRRATMATTTTTTTLARAWLLLRPGGVGFHTQTCCLHVCSPLRTLPPHHHMQAKPSKRRSCIHYATARDVP